MKILTLFIVVLNICSIPTVTSAQLPIMKILGVLNNFNLLPPPLDIAVSLSKRWLSSKSSLSSPTTTRRTESKNAYISHHNRNDKALMELPTSRDESYTMENGGGSGFPSLEGALLSLAFLTFAVFVIDLIQVSMNKQSQLIGRYNNGVGVPIFGRKRRKRSISASNLHQAKVSSLAPSYEFGIPNPLENHPFSDSDSSTVTPYGSTLIFRAIENPLFI